jgi:hypothetical protein
MNRQWNENCCTVLDVKYSDFASIKIKTLVNYGKYDDKLWLNIPRLRR